MKKLIVVVIAILFVILAVKLKSTSTSNNPVNPASPDSGQGGQAQNKNSNNGLETKESNEGPVTVAVTPQSLGTSATWDFAISLNTHSEELSQDLVAVSELVDDQGNSYKPLSWEGAPPGGHHREGVLNFEPILPKPKFVEIKIKNVGGIKERSFKWIL